MMLLALIRWLSRALGRFNDSFGRVAVASGVERSELGVNPDSVVGVLGELERRDEHQKGA